MNQLINNLEYIIPNWNVRLGEFIEHCKKNNIPIQKTYFDWNGHVWVYVESSISFREFTFKNHKVRNVMLDFMSTDSNAKLNFVDCKYYNDKIDTWIDGRLYKRSMFKGGSIF